MKRAPLLMLALAAAACGEPYSNEDLRFVRAVPQPEQVMIDLPGQPEGNDAMPGAPATYYLQLRDTGETINDAIFGPVGTVQQIAAAPPDHRDTDVRAWGPIATSTGVAHVLYMVRTSTPGVRVPTSTSTILPIAERIDFVMYGRRAGTADDIPILSGGFAATEEDGSGIGTIHVDLDAVARLDPSSSDAGQYSGAYDTRDGLAVVFGFQDPSGARAFHRFQRKRDTVDFLSFQQADLFMPDGTPSAQEVIWMVGRWLPDNRGRADVRYEGGDLPTSASGGECWDDAFRRVYFNASTPELGAPEGMVEACAPGLREPLFLGR